MRHWSLTRMLCRPARSPRSFSSRFPGGTRRSSRDRAAWRMSSLRCASRLTASPNLGVRWRCQTAAVSRSRNDSSTSRACNGQRDERRPLSLVAPACSLSASRTASGSAGTTRPAGGPRRGRHSLTPAHPVVGDRRPRQSATASAPAFNRRRSLRESCAVWGRSGACGGRLGHTTGGGPPRGPHGHRSATLMTTATTTAPRRSPLGVRRRQSERVPALARLGVDRTPVRTRTSWEER